MKQHFIWKLIVSKMELQTRQIRIQGYQQIHIQKNKKREEKKKQTHWT